MTYARLIATLALIVVAAPGGAVVLTFDDIPPSHMVGGYYQSAYGVVFPYGFWVADHSGSVWGPPHSPNNVLVSDGLGFEFGFKWGHYPPLYPPYATSVGGYFSTEEGVVLEMIGYYSAPHGDTVVVGEVTIGAPGQSWNNVYVQLTGSPKPVNFVIFEPITTDALLRFCADDMTIDFVPEPSSIAFLALALASVGIGVVRRRR